MTDLREIKENGLSGYCDKDAHNWCKNPDECGCEHHILDGEREAEA